MDPLNLRIEKDIAIIEFDQPDSKVNVLNTETMRGLDAMIDQLSAKSEVKALLFVSKKDGVFIAGADIKEIENIKTAEEAVDKAEKGKEVLNKIERSGLVTVAVINGVCLGGGLELALACKYRVAGLGTKVRLGLPEVKLGIIPGFGGTQRLPRLVGLTRSLGMILSGDMVFGKDAMRYGLVDRLFPDIRLLEDAMIFTRGILQKTTRVKRKEKKKLSLAFLEDTPPGRNMVFSQARKNVLGKTKGFYPSPLKAIDVISRTYGRDMKSGSRIESEAFGELAVTEISKNLIKVFYLSEEYKKLPWVSPGIKPDAVNKCGILGAGVMGGGIAQLVSFNNIPSRLKDINYEALKSAMKTAKGLFDYAVKKRKMKEADAEFKMGLISPTTSYKGFENTDLVIEAVVEDINIKQKVFKELGKVVPAGTVLASNTSSLPIIDISRDTDHPERAVGLHFFNPVHRMPLVEVIRSGKSSERAIATTIAFARKIGKVVIVVKDVPGFLINRILLSYMNEAGFLFDEGMEMTKIDKIARDFGMPMGPVELIDEVGIDVGYKVAKILENSYGTRMKVATILEKVKHEGLLGKKAKAGFYLHKGKERLPNPAVTALARARWPGRISDETALKRMIYIMVNEAARCLEEKVADRPETVDIGMIMGAGFPPFRAGLLRYADTVGIRNVVNDLEELEKGLSAPRFKPCGLLTDIGNRNGGFYGNVR